LLQLRIALFSNYPIDKRKNYLTDTLITNTNTK